MKRALTVALLTGAITLTPAWADPAPPTSHDSARGHFAPNPDGPGPPGRHSHATHREWGVRRGDMMRELDLTDAQRTKLADVRDAQQRKAIRAQADIHIAMLDMRKLMRAETPDERAIDLQIDKVAALRVALAKSRVAARLEKRSILTPEQRKQMRERYLKGGDTDSPEGERPRGEHPREDGEL